MVRDWPSWLQSPESLIPRGLSKSRSLLNSGMTYSSDIIEALGNAISYPQKVSFNCLNFFFEIFMMKYLDLPVWLVFGYFDVEFSMIFVKFLRNYDQSYDQDDQIY